MRADTDVPVRRDGRHATSHPAGEDRLLTGRVGDAVVGVMAAVVAVVLLVSLVRTSPGLAVVDRPAAGATTPAAPSPSPASASDGSDPAALPVTGQARRHR